MEISVSGLKGRMKRRKIALQNRRVVQISMGRVLKQAREGALESEGPGRQEWICRMKRGRLSMYMGKRKE